MKIPTITFFNSVGGVGKTTLVYHTAWMLADMGMRVVAADLDPQSSLTVAFLDEDELRDLWQEREKRRTVFGCVEPILHAVGDTGRPDLVRVNDGIALLAGDPLLSVFEDELARSWLECGMGRQAAFRAVSAFWHILQAAAKQHEADCVLIDIGPGLGAITRSALIASENVVFPVSPDLFSLQGLRNIGPTCRKWRGEWRERLAKSGGFGFDLPSETMRPLGYVVLKVAQIRGQITKSHEKWIERIPREYRANVFDGMADSAVSIADDPCKLAEMKDYRSLVFLAQEARKPVFHLTAADGALGAHAAAARDAGKAFQALALQVLERAGIPIPHRS